MFMDEPAYEPQRERLQVNLRRSGRRLAGAFAKRIGDVRGMEYVPNIFEIADDRAYWSAEVPGKASAGVQADGK
jgi:hypothetical protein